MATIDLTDETFESTVTQDGIVFVDVWADWCGPCKQFAPTYEKASEEHPDVTFAKLDTEAYQQLAAALQIQAIPTLMAFRDGILLYREAGALPPQAFDQLVNQVKELDMDDVRQQVAEQNAQADAEDNK